MKIFKLTVQNFRLLKDFSIDLEDELSLVIGKNNSGKTSILAVLDQFLNDKVKFTFHDLNIEFRKHLADLIESKDEILTFSPIGIKLKIFISYDEKDDLSNVSRVLMDLDPANNVIVLGFEHTLHFADFIRLKGDYTAFRSHEEQKRKNDPSYPVKELSDFLKNNIGNYFRPWKKSFAYQLDNKTVDEENYVDLDKEGISIKDIINFKYISANRDVSNKDIDKTLSRQTSQLYRKKENSDEKSQATEDFKDQLSGTDVVLTNIYKDLFKDVIDKVKAFGGVSFNESEIEIISNLQHRELLEGNTTVVYSHDSYKLPEHYNGLGYMNLISMIFEIEILIQDFKREREKKPADINLLFIEEPEAHTHPQMQYVFIKNIKRLLSGGIQRDDGYMRTLQYIISTHSSHIVADSDFDDIKYLKLNGKNSIEAKNLKVLQEEYAVETEQYDFLKMYLTLSRAEVFFAAKVILIEGDTERLLIPAFMRKIDEEEHARFESLNVQDPILPLLAQNISVIEVGAYGHIFKRFIAFLGVKALMITDIDSVSKQVVGEDGKERWEACSVAEGTSTSNPVLKDFLNGTPWEEMKILPIDKRTFDVGHSRICLCYQQEDLEYHPRSFEDAFINQNKEFVDKNKASFLGLRNQEKLDITMDMYQVAEQFIRKKTHFALDILFHSHPKFGQWHIPPYIKEGLLWLKQG